MPLLSKSDCESNYSRQYNSQLHGLGATRANLLRLLRSLDLVSWSTHEESGRLDRRAFTRFATGSTAVFSKREVGEAETSAVSILIDCSGSMMDWGRINIAESVTIQLARLLDKARVAFCITGFSGRNKWEELKDSGSNGIRTQSIRVEHVQYTPFKTWKENLAKASAKLGAIAQCIGGSTPDYSAIRLKLEELASREEKRKIMFLITDADGYDQVHMQHLQSFADKQHIKIIAIGIGRTDVNKCFTNGEDVSNVHDLAGASFNKLLNELR